MASTRIIKPGFFTNEDLAECSPRTRLCFIGLLILADSGGRLEDNPNKIKMQLFHFDDVDVDRCLDELAQYGFIERCEMDCAPTIFIPKFVKHQTPPYHRAVQ